MFTMYTKGKCLDMCPRDEAIMRENERLLHVLEVIPETRNHKYPKADYTRVVKSFSRSAAGNDLTKVDQLRPPSILLKTVEYLLSSAIEQDHRVSTISRYDFIVDRLRSVSQDCIIQQITPEDSIKILEPVVRFHILNGYRLCHLDMNTYDPTLNKKHLLEYLKRLLVCYDEIENQILINKNDLHHQLESLSLNSKQTDKNTTPNLLENRPLMEAAYIICNLGETEPLLRYLTMPSTYKSFLPNLAFQISLLHIKNNFVRQCMLMKTLPPILLCGAVLHLPAIRRSALEVMCCAYSSKQLTFPVHHFKSLLFYESDQEVIQNCQNYGIQLKDLEHISFSKESFDHAAAKVSHQKCFFLDRILDDLSIEKLCFEKHNQLCV